MASKWSEAAQQLAAMLEEQTQYEADANAQDLNLPGYWITPVSVNFDTLGGQTYLAAFDIYAITSNRSVPLDALDELSEMHTALRDTLGSVAIGTGAAEVTAVTLGNKAPDALPALKISITVEVE